VRSRRWIWMTLALALSLAAISAAGADEQAKKETKQEESKPAAQTAVLDVPNLMEGTLLRDLAKALNGKPGIIVAQVEKETKLFHVTFATEKTNPETILKTVQELAKEAKLLKVVPADAKAAGHDCGKCPKAKGCPGSKGAAAPEKK